MMIMMILISFYRITDTLEVNIKTKDVINLLSFSLQEFCSN